MSCNLQLHGLITLKINNLKNSNIQCQHAFTEYKLIHFPETVHISTCLGKIT